MADLLEMLGALIPAWLVSRLFLWLFTRVTPPTRRLALAYVSSLALSWVLRAWGTANGGDWQWTSGVIGVLPQLAWYV